MRNKTIKEFARAYDGLELLKHTNAGIQLGDLYDKRGMFNNELDYIGYNIAYKVGLSSTESEALLDKLRDVVSYEGTFAGIVLKDKFSAGGEMTLPSANVNLTGKVAKESVKYFEIGAIRTKVLRDLLRLEVEDAIENLIEKDKKEYRQELKKMFIVEAIFYGKEIKVAIDKETEVDVNATFGESVGDVSVSVDSESNQLFTISGSDYPFAVDLKKVKDFI